MKKVCPEIFKSGRGTIGQAGSGCIGVAAAAEFVGRAAGAPMALTEGATLAMEDDVIAGTVDAGDALPYTAAPNVAAAPRAAATTLLTIVHNLHLALLSSVF